LFLFSFFKKKFRIEGGELFEQIANRGSFTEIEARKIMNQVAQGICHMHSIGIIHRDLKVSFFFFLSFFHFQL